MQTFVYAKDTCCKWSNNLKVRERYVKKGQGRLQSTGNIPRKLVHVSYECSNLGDGSPGKS